MKLLLAHTPKLRVRVPVGTLIARCYIVGYDTTPRTATRGWPAWVFFLPRGGLNNLRFEVKAVVALANGPRSWYQECEPPIMGCAPDRPWFEWLDLKKFRDDSLPKIDFDFMEVGDA